MFIRFNPQTMEIDVLCGIEEDYKPSKEIKKIYKDVEQLRGEMKKFTEKVVQPGLKDIHGRIKKLNDKHIVIKEE